MLALTFNSLKPNTDMQHLISWLQPPVLVSSGVWLRFNATSFQNAKNSDYCIVVCACCWNQSNKL